MKNPSKKNRQITRALFIMLGVFILAALLSGAGERIENKYALKRDFSFNRVTSYGSVTKEVLSSLDTDVRIYALFTPGEEDQHLLALLERYQAASPHLHYTVENLAKNPMLAHTISDSIDDSAVTTDCLIIYCPQKDRTRILTAQDYVSQSYDPESGTFVLSGAAYESSLTEAIAYVTSDALPSLHLLTGHGELSGNETQALRALLTSRGYALADVDLSRSDELPSGGLLLILSPRKDLADAELKRLMDFAGRGGGFIITTDYSDPSDMKNFNALLRAYGVAVAPGVVVAEESDRSSYFDSPLYLMPYMQHSEITTPLISAGRDRLMLAGARPLTILPSLGTNIQAVSVLKSGKATVRSFDGASLGEKPAASDASVYDLAVYADRADDQGTHSKALVLGNSSAFTMEWLYANTYSTEFLLQAIQTIYPQHPTDLMIRPKAAFRPSLGFTSIALPLAMIVLVPLAILAWAWFVLAKRRRL